MNKNYNFEKEDVFDSRDVEERIEELEDLAEDNSIDKEEAEELKELLELKAECECYGWEYGITFINYSYWKEYAEELFDECYAHDVPDSIKNYIDYDSFASDLEYDYSTVTFRGSDFYWRES